jgi:ADP-heptose:LPS heptosyltransferase
MLLKVYNKLSKHLLWRIRSYLQYIVFPIRLKKKKKSILIYRLDAIGDYFIFRNCLDSLVNSEKYKTYKFEFLGNIEIKSVFDKYDSHFFVSAFFINKERFYNDIFYHLRILFRLKSIEYDLIINPVLSHEDLFNNYIPLFLNGNKISFRSDQTILQKYFPDSKVFNSIIIPDIHAKFEYFRNIEFCEKLTETKIEFKDANFPILKKNENYVAFFIGARDEFRRWSEDNFSNLINLILDKYTFQILILGGQSEFLKGENILMRIKKPEDVTNLCGQSNILELLELINNAKLLISNETVAVHVAASTKTTTICISNGNHYGRFNPYPKLFCNINTLYPPTIFELSEETRIKRFLYGSSLDINEIDPFSVFNLFEKII